MSSSDFDKLNEEMLTRFLQINPDAATMLGLRDPYDRLLPHGGFKRYRETHELLEQWSSAASDLAENRRLTLEQQLVLEVLNQWKEIYKFGLYEYPLWKMYPDAFLGIFTTLFDMLVIDYAPLGERLSAVRDRIDQIPVHLGQFRTRFDEGGIAYEWVQQSIESCSNFRTFLDSVRTISMKTGDATLIQQLDMSIKRVNEEMDNHSSWLESLREKPDVPFAMGKERFEKLMRLRGLPMTPNQMLSLGEKYLEDLKKEREVVAARLTSGGSVDDAQAKLVQDHPGTFEDALRIAAELMAEAKQFAVSNGIITANKDAVAVVQETPEFLRSIIPFAMCKPSPLFHKEKKGFYFLTRPANPDSLGEFANRTTLVNTAVHEAFPGHFHQMALAGRKHWMFHLPHAVFWSDSTSCALPFAMETIEGWALYCEQMMFDHGYHKSDEMAFQILSDAIWRACRIVADIRVACGEITATESAEWMAKEAGMPLDGLVMDAKMNARTPGYVLSYLIGRHMIQELKKNLEEDLGPEFDERKFHDLLAGYGILPFCIVIKVVRLQMKGLA